MKSTKTSYSKWIQEVKSLLIKGGLSQKETDNKIWKLETDVDSIPPEEFWRTGKSPKQFISSLSRRVSK